jgi:hypothetical protein
MATAYPYLNVDGYGLVRFDFIGTAGVGHAQCELAFHNTSGVLVNPGDANTIQSAFGTNVMPIISTLVTLQSVQVVEVMGGVVQEFISTNAPVSGGQSGALLPPNVCMLIKKQTGLLGKANRGRMYLPGASESLVVDPATISVAHLATIQTAMTAFYTAMVAAHFQPFLIKKTSNPLLFHAVALTGFLPEALFASQRRRLRKAAHH